jgi:hypothetical protein
MWVLGVRLGDLNESRVSNYNYIQPINTLETWLKLVITRSFEIYVLIQHKWIIRFGGSGRVASEIEKGMKGVQVWKNLNYSRPGVIPS